MTNIWHVRSTFGKWRLWFLFTERNKPIAIVRASIHRDDWSLEIRDVSIENHWKRGCIRRGSGELLASERCTTGISFTKKYREPKNSCTDWVSSITFDMTWNSKKKSFNCSSFEGKEEEERKLSDIKSSHNGSSKEIKSINNLHKKRTVTQRKLPAIKIYFRGEWNERRFFAQLNIFRFFGAPISSRSS